MTFFSSALINFAVPSGGGHWVIQGPFVIPAAQALGADLGKSVMAIAYGEQWMNMAQPFWGAASTGNRRTRCPRHHGLLHHCPALLRRHFRHWFNAVLTATLQTEGI
ncbi:TIGR00366 family protein [Escherichia coli]